MVSDLLPARGPHGTPDVGPDDTPPLGPDDNNDSDNDDDDDDHYLVTVLPGHIVTLGLLVSVVTITDLLLNCLALLLVRGAALLIRDCLTNLL